jgi:glutaredoxin-like YruB-family protein
MKHPGLSQRPGKLKLLVTTAVLALVFLFAFLTDRLPGVLDRSVSGPLPLAEAEETKRPQTPPKKAEKAGNSVIVYVTSWCPACRMTTDYLQDKRIPFVVKDVERNETYMKEMVKKVGGYRGVPVLDINGKILLGFNPQVLDQLAK